MDRDEDVDVVMSCDVEEPKGRRESITAPAHIEYSPSYHIAMRNAKKRLLENPGKRIPHEYTCYSLFARLVWAQQRKRKIAQSDSEAEPSKKRGKRGE